jgi:predicted AAA+ superfamily ATPase
VSSHSLAAEHYLPRTVDGELDELFTGAAAISLEGAKGVGKSATAAERATRTFLMEDPAVREAVAAAPELLRGTGPALIDEWQHLPMTWDVVRRAVDAGAAPGQFLLTGSASSFSPGSHSGAGRILKVRMRPLSLAERGLSSPTVSLAAILTGTQPDVSGETSVGLPEYVEEICGSGFPGIRGLPQRVRRAQLSGYVDRVVDRDMVEAGLKVRKEATLRRWMAAYAAATSSVASYEKIRDAATPGEGNKPARSTTEPYRNMLERLFILDPLPAWQPTHSHLRQLAAAPKHHLTDPALATTLLGLGPASLLHGDQGPVPRPQDGSLLGALFESLVTLGVRTYAQRAEASVGHLRTHRGDHEVDLIVERDDGRIVAIETKLATTVSQDDTVHLRWLRDRLGDDLLDAVLVTSGRYAYRRPEDGVAVVPAALLGP